MGLLQRDRRSLAVPVWERLSGAGRRAGRVLLGRLWDSVQLWERALEPLWDSRAPDSQRQGSGQNPQELHSWLLPRLVPPPPLVPESAKRARGPAEEEAAQNVSPPPT